MSEYQISNLSSKDVTAVLYSPAEFKLMPAFSRNIMLLYTEVAGCGHVEGIQDLLSALALGQRVILRREPENPYDEQAVLVLNQNMEKLGYIPRRQNTVIANLMDAGKSLFGLIDWIDAEAAITDPWKALKITVFMED